MLEPDTQALPAEALYAATSTFILFFLYKVFTPHWVRQQEKKNAKIEASEKEQAARLARAEEKLSKADAMLKEESQARMDLAVRVAALESTLTFLTEDRDRVAQENSRLRDENHSLRAQLAAALNAQDG